MLWGIKYTLHIIIIATHYYVAATCTSYSDSPKRGREGGYTWQGALPSFPGLIILLDVVIGMH